MLQELNYRIKIKGPHWKVLRGGLLERIRQWVIGLKMRKKEITAKTSLALTAKAIRLGRYYGQPRDL